VGSSPPRHPKRQGEILKTGKLYNGPITAFYNSEDAIPSTRRSPGFVKLLPSLPGSWRVPENASNNSLGRSLPRPVIVQPNNPRYQIDRKEGYVSWMGFTFYFSFNLATGLSLFDIRFNDSRVIYSIGLQEALSHYAGSDPMHGSMYFRRLVWDGSFHLTNSSSNHQLNGPR
jgi:primary-amine oxidase